MLCRGRTFFLPEVRLRKEAWTARPVGTGVWTRTGTGVATLDFWNFENEHVIENYNETTSVEVVTRWKSLNERNGNAAPNLRTKWCSSNLKPPWHPQASKPRAWPGIANFYGSGLSAQLCFSWFSQFVAWVYWSLGIFNRTQEICIWRPRFKLTHTSRTRARRMCHRCFSSCLGIPSSIKLCSGWICVICQDIQLWSKDRHAQWVAVLWRVVHGSPSSNSLRSQMLKTNINCWINRNWLL